MEENINNEKQESVAQARNESYLTGTIGAILGGIIAAIPWILTYCFGNMIVAILSILIAFGAFTGYKLFRGKIGKLLPVIIAVVSILVIVVSTLVVCPFIMMAQEGINVSFKNLQLIYKSDEFMSAIIQDLLVSLLFTIIGIAASIKSMYMQIKEGVKDIKFSKQAVDNKSYEQSKEKAETVKKAFETLNAFDKENAVNKEEVINELELTYNVEPKKAKKYFNETVYLGIVKKVKGKYYYNTVNEEENFKKSVNVNYNQKTVAIVTIVLVIIAVIIIGAFAAAGKHNNNKSINDTTDNISGSIEYTIPGTDVKLNITSEMNLYSTEEEIAVVLGYEYAEYYNFVILTKDSKVEIYGILIDKSELNGEYTLDELARNDRENASKYYDNTTELITETIGNIEFKKYGYNDEANNFTSYIYITEVGDKYMCIDTYSDIGNEAKIDSIMEELFK